MDGKNSFILYCDIGQHLELLSDEDAGLLFKGIVHYADTGEPPQLPPMAAMAFSFIQAQIDRDQEKWNTTREKRRAAGKSGGLKSGESRQRSNEAKEANASNPKQNEADEADNVNVTVPVNGNVPVTVINNREKADKPPRPRFTPPSENDAIAYFCEQGSSAAEAKSFLDYYAAIGWKVGGRATMKNWQAAARNWIHRAGQYSHPQTKQVAAEPATDTISRAAERLASGNFSNLEDAFL
jgi:hypothetical protein